MSILEQADVVEITSEVKEEFSKMAESLSAKEDLNVYYLFQYFDLQGDDVVDRNIMGKIKEIYEWMQSRGEGLTSIRDLDIQLGKPNYLTKLDKIFTYIKLDKDKNRAIQEATLIHKQQQKLHEDSHFI